MLYLLLFSAFSLGILVDGLFRRLSSKRTVSIISSADYEAKVRCLLDSGSYVVIKNFGYTGETVWADLLRFEDRYKGIEIKMLHRDWLKEAIEENRHNESSKPSRRWEKAAEIRRFGTQPWGHALNRAIRYYSHHPIVKGTIFCKSRGEGRIAFLTFYHWIERPAEGGSIFKGANMQMLMFDENMPGAKPIIDYLESQFDYEWAKSPTARELQQVELGEG